MNSLYISDLQRYRGGGNLRIKRYLFWFRKAQTSKSPLLQPLFRKISSYHGRRYGLEISYLTKIGKGLYLGHAFNITINPAAVIGENCNIHKGAVIGQTNRGEKKGAPIIGNRVWIGINAVIVGKIIIGDDVMIAPNSFVNIDVPSHSIVFGNPCIIKHRNHATEGYIENEAK